MISPRHSHRITRVRATQNLKYDQESVPIWQVPRRLEPLSAASRHARITWKGLWTGADRRVRIATACKLELVLQVRGCVIGLFTAVNSRHSFIWEEAAEARTSNFVLLLRSHVHGLRTHGLRSAYSAYLLLGC